MSLFAELKRRSVVQVGTTYLVASWLVVQVIDLVGDAIGAPPWVFHFLLLLLGVGFVFALVISWVYELTPDGLKPDAEAQVDESFRAAHAKRLSWLTFVLGTVAVGVLLVGRFYAPSEAAPHRVETRIAVTDIPAQSIAILPFIALSADVDDAYFGKGVAEELANALAQVSSLKVAARTSTFSLVDKGEGLEQIGATLKVAHVLEGSVRRSGQRVRITAQLVNVQEGYNVWSKTYDRLMTDILAVQHEIVADISRALQIRLGVGAGAGRAAERTVAPAAYELYLKGLDLWWTRDMVGHRADAIEHFLRVTELAPQFADGWAAYSVSIAFSDFTFAAHLDAESYNDEIERAFQRAIAIDPGNPRARAGLVYHHINREIDIPAAAEHLDRALAGAPNYAFTNYAAAQYYFSIGDERAAKRAISRALIADPLNDTLRRIQFQHLSAFGEFQADAPFLEGLEDCAESKCGPLDWLRAWTALVAALHTGTNAEIRQMRDTFSAVQSHLDGAGDFGRDAHEFLVAYADGVLGDDEHTSYWQETDFLESSTVGHFVFDASILAQRGRGDAALAVIERVSEGNRFFASRGITYVLSEGRFEMPNLVRRHPTYHAVWQAPGMADLAQARRDNGVTTGLPLPTETDIARQAGLSPGER